MRNDPPEISPEHRAQRLHHWRDSIQAQIAQKQAQYDADPTVRLGISIASLRRLECEVLEVEDKLKAGAPDIVARLSSLRIAVGCHQLLHEDPATQAESGRELAATVRP